MKHFHVLENVRTPASQDWPTLQSVPYPSSFPSYPAPFAQFGPSVQPTSSLTPPSSALARRGSPEEYIKNGKLDTLGVGQYFGLRIKAHGSKGCEELESFIVKHSGKVTMDTLGNCDMNDPMFPHALSIGNFIALRLGAASRQSSGDVPREDFDRVTGACFNVKSTFFFPTEPPFNGHVISLAGFPRQTCENHVFVKKAIFWLLSRSCTTQEDIQAVNWVLNNENSSKSSKSQIFPSSLYSSLEDLNSAVPPTTHQRMANNSGNLSCEE
uniref:Uncharacterized protein n=1 Tax=Caenorhabditis japonica TaxID=281687 RepID=A0A8R1IF11_CAEJA